MAAAEVKVETQAALPQQVLDASADALVMLPHIIRDDGTPEYSQSTKTAIKLLNDKGIKATIIADGKVPLYRDERAIEWLGPAIFVGAAWATANPHAISIALNVISAYLYDLFKGRTEDTSAKLSVSIAKKNGTVKKISYRGPVSGLATLESAVSEVCKESENDDGGD